MARGGAVRSCAVAAGLVWAVVVGGCTSGPPSDRPALPSAAASRSGPTAGELCLQELSQRGISYEPMPMYATASACNVTNGVRVAGLLTPFSRPASLSCPMALRLDEFEINVVQMAAQRYFKRKVIEVRQVGSYTCRNIAGSHRLSMHASGQAIDIAGFLLDDGTLISVKNDWSGRGAPAKFLHEVARGACGLFSVVLTPNTNADHHEHLHLDVGPWPLCDA
ncbi:MAG: extensin family protein [Alphaproteobacteria bacterium]|nr:extensin family protein [Alphaproteobacteria bacterium]